MLRPIFISRKDLEMAFNTAFQPVLDGINALKAEVEQLKQQAANAPTQAALDAANAQIAQLQQDAVDTESALAAALPPAGQ